MPSAIHQLLDEISWEGNARKYRDGGRGKENVLTAEVFQALDFLPRTEFLGHVIADTHHVETSPGQPEALAFVPGDAEDLEVEVLCGDRTSELGLVRAQPDVLMTSEKHLILVEAKAIWTSSFQPEQIARELVVAHSLADGRQATLLLVLGTAPPVRVQGRGRLAIEESAREGLAAIRARDPRVPEIEDLPVQVRWATWTAIADGVASAADTFANDSPSALRSVQRIATALSNAVKSHS